ncbi:hypothetical protein [Microcoleus sp. herbarium12]|uniref:hypothetical protein n=1 Tax=Microcoleus sp. herbarium12 TaxID=3055437 RepID=UPI002FD1C084
MTAITTSRVESIRPRWQAIVMVALIFWLSGSVILDLLVMPSLYVSGMMVSPDFATAGNLMFWGFNRVELICSGVVATGLMVLSNLMGDSGKRSRTAIVLSLVLLAIALIDTYGLTPQMSALGMQLNLFDSATEAPAGMNSLHQGYFVLEAMKLAVGGTLLGWCYENQV